MPRPSLLIEKWLPIAEIGAESMRERGASSALPPLYFLHVWWARRPLISGRAAILAGLLPQWSVDWPETLLKKFPDEKSYHHWYLHLIGVRGDPVRGMKVIRMAKAKGIQLNFHPYGGAPRAFTLNPSVETLETLDELLRFTWGSSNLNVLDPFSGGGSIPFEALRYGFTTYANDLNPVATTILKATLDYPIRYGPGFAEDIKKWGNIWASRAKEKLEQFFPRQPHENIFAYLWARTVQHNGKIVPLSPNWWLATGENPVAVRVLANPEKESPEFTIVTGQEALASKPDDGTVSRGGARSPWDGSIITSDYIKSEAQAGRMGEILYCVVRKVPGGLSFRAPTEKDISAATSAALELKRREAEWLAKNLLPVEEVPMGSKTSDLRNYGIFFWNQAFSSRQLLSQLTFLSCLQEVSKEMRSSMEKERCDAVETYLGLALDIAAVYNNVGCRFNPDRGIRSRFDRHDFGFVYSHAEFDASENLLPWAIYQQEDAYKKISNLSYPAQSFFTGRIKKFSDALCISKGSATSLSGVSGKSVHNITVDPPYYDNVQYSELSDFFYVWLKRSVGHLFPEFFIDELTNKDDEAVANPARFAALGNKKKELAEQDYERKMAAAFREMHRVLRDDGTLTVMFTHKRVEAWDTLASALIGAGFAIQASWPIHTESEYSLHQAKKNAAASTILLVCRKREIESATGEPVWWDDIQTEVRRVAREKAAEYAAQSIGGADLYISVFGPTLSVISQHWPVLTSEIDAKSGQPRPLRPEIALDLAREEVVRLRKQGLLAGRDIQFDAVTDWYLMAWDAYQAEQFPYDEARKLAIALGVDLDHDLMGTKRLAAKKGEYVLLQTPVQRRKNGMVDDDVMQFEHWVDAAHTAMMVYSEDGAGACDAFLQKSGLKRDQTFKAVLQAMLNAIPRSRIKGQFVRPEAEALENMRLAFFDDLTVPKEEELEMPKVEQLGLFATESENMEEEEE